MDAASLAIASWRPPSDLSRSARRVLLVLVQLVLLAELPGGLADLAVEDVLAADQARGERLGVGGDVLDVADEPPEVGLGGPELLARLFDIAALEGFDRLADCLEIEPRAAVLGEGGVDVQCEPSGVVLECTLGVGQGLELGGVLGRVGGAPGLLVLAAGQVARLAGETVGLAGLGVEQGAAEVGRLADEPVQLVADGVLPGLETVELGAAVRGGVRLVGDPLLAIGQLVQLAAARGPLIALGQFALELVEALAHRRQPFAGPAEVVGRAGRILIVAGARASRGGLGLELGDLPGGPCQLAGRGVLAQRPGELLEPLDQVAQGPLAFLDRHPAAGVPLAFAASGRVGGLAQPLRLLAAGSDVLPERVERRLDRRPPHPRQPRRDRLGTLHDRQHLRGRPGDVRTLRPGPVVGHAQAICRR